MFFFTLVLLLDIYNGRECHSYFKFLKEDEASLLLGMCKSGKFVHEEGGGRKMNSKIVFFFWHAVGFYFHCNRESHWLSFAVEPH